MPTIVKNNTHTNDHVVVCPKCQSEIAFKDNEVSHISVQSSFNTKRNEMGVMTNNVTAEARRVDTIHCPACSSSISV